MAASCSRRRPPFTGAARRVYLAAVSSIETEAREAAAGGAGKRSYVRGMFSEIAPRYDLLNHLLSASIDRRWRAQAIAALAVPRTPDGLYLDLCAGTLDVAAQLCRTRGFRGRVLAADFAEPMLREGLRKNVGGRIVPVVADALRLPLPDGSVDGAIVAFGVRNLEDLDAGLREVRRVCRRGAHFVILELGRPRRRAVRVIYELYFRHVLPLVGRLVSGHRTAYAYLPDSVANFPTGDELARRLTAAGFEDVRWRPLTLGIAAMHVGTR